MRSTRYQGMRNRLVTVYHLQHSLVLDVVLALSLDGCLDDGKNAAGSPRVDDRSSSWLHIHHLGFSIVPGSTAEDKGNPSHPSLENGSLGSLIGMSQANCQF